MTPEKSQNVQDVFLNHVRKNKTPVTVFLVNGVKLQGIITWFDNFCVLLRRDAHSQLVYKHAISTVMPGQPIQLFEPGKERHGSLNRIDITTNANSVSTGRALVVHPALKSAPGRQPSGISGRSVEARLEEAIGLARAINLDVIGAEIARVARPRADSLLGGGPSKTSAG